MSRLQTNAIRHLGSAVDNMMLDNAGRVLMPNQPAFCACGAASDVTVAAGSPLPFGTLITSMAKTARSSGYSTSTYKFTAPVAGLYLFIVNLYQAGGGAYAQIIPRLNGSQVGMNDTLIAMSQSGTTGAMTPGVFQLELSANDSVDISPRSGYSAKFYGAHSYFSGYLIG